MCSSSILTTWPAVVNTFILEDLIVPPHLQEGIWQKAPLCQLLSLVVWHKACLAHTSIVLFTLSMPKMLAFPMCCWAAHVHVLSLHADLCISC